MAKGDDATLTLLYYFTHLVGETNNIELPTLPRGVTFEFTHGFLQMIKSNQFNRASCDAFEEIIEVV